MHPLKSSFLFLALSLGLWLGASCDDVPQELDPDFSWQASITELENPLLGSCQYQGKVYMVGGLSQSSALYRWTGRRWVKEATQVAGQRLWACWAGPGQLVFAVGQGGTIIRHNAEGWHRDTLPEEIQKATFYGVWGMPDGTAVAVGDGLLGTKKKSVIIHFDGKRWQQADTDFLVAPTLWGIWGVNNRYWAVGSGGSIAYFDGEEWTPSNSQIEENLYGIYGVSDKEMYAVGGNGSGIIRRWNGSSWVYFDSPSNALRTIWTAPGQSLYVAGEGGFVARYTRHQGMPTPSLRVEKTPFPELRIHHIIGVKDALVGAAATILTGDNGEWQGAILSHGKSFAGVVFE